MSRGVEPGQVLHGEVVLVLDGDQVARDRIRRVLGRQGCSATTTASVRAARAMLRRQPYSTVIATPEVRGVDTRRILPALSAHELPTCPLLLVGEDMSADIVDDWGHVGARLLPRFGTSCHSLVKGVAECISRTKSLRAAKASDCPPIDLQLALFDPTITDVRVIRTRDGGTIDVEELEARYCHLVSSSQPPTQTQLRYLRLWALGHSRTRIGWLCKPPVGEQAVKKGLRVLRHKAGVRSMDELAEKLGIVVTPSRG